MNFLNSDEFEEQLSLINEVLNEKIDTTSLYKLNDLYLYCLKDIGMEKDRRYSNLYEKIIEEILIKGCGFNKKTKKSVLYFELENIISGFLDISNDILEEEFKKLIDKGEKTESDYKIFNLMLSALITGATLKTIERFKDLLPMKRDNKDFKEEYPFLYISKKKYIKFKNKEELKNDDNNYSKINENNATMKIVEQLPLLRKEVKKENGEVVVKLKYEGGFIKIDTENKDDVIAVLEEVNKIVGQNEQVLLMYIMKKVFEQLKPEDVKKGCNIEIDVKEYCQLTDTRYSVQVCDRMIQTIKNLSKILVEYDYIIPDKDKKGKKQGLTCNHLKESPLVLNRGAIGTYAKDMKSFEKEIIKVSVGAWIETLSSEQYRYISNEFFKLKPNSKDKVTRSIWIKLYDQYRANRKNNAKEIKLAVFRLTKLLGVDEERIKEKGYNEALKKPLEKALDNIVDFGWRYKNGNHKSRKDFEDDILIFENDKLYNYYNKKGYKAIKQGK